MVRTPRVRISSAHASTVSKFSSTSGSTSGTSSVVITPSVPSSAIRSPSSSTVPFTRARRSARSISSSPTPHTAGRPIPRATSAAWLALPPSEVTMPRAAKNPATSSASVKGRISTTWRPDSAASTALSAVKTISPLAAPGDAATPRASTW